MSSYINQEKCICGKLKNNINSTNWLRHLNSCQTSKIKSKNTDILSFFSNKSTKKSNCKYYLYIKIDCINY